MTGNEPITYVDLHAHTAHSRFNEGVAHSPNDLLQQAATQGLGGIALTGHDTFSGIEGAVEQAEKLGIILVPGIEIMTRKGLRAPHLIGLLPTATVLELSKTNAKSPRLKSPEYTADWIHDHGGIVIAAHPKPDGNLISLGHEEVMRLRGRLDAVETHTRRGHNTAMGELAAREGLASIGSSDSHRLEEVGLAKTAVFGTCKTAEDVIQAIKEGRVQGLIENPIPTALQGERDVKSLIQAYKTKKQL